MSSPNVETANKFIKTYNEHAELLFCLLNLYQENMRMRPRLYIENVSRGHPPNPSQLKQVFIWESVDPFALAEDSALAYSDSLALTELSRLVKPSVYLEKSWLS